MSCNAVSFKKPAVLSILNSVESSRVPVNVNVPVVWARVMTVPDGITLVFAVVTLIVHDRKSILPELLKIGLLLLSVTTTSIFDTESEGLSKVIAWV